MFGNFSRKIQRYLYIRFAPILTSDQSINSRLSSRDFLKRISLVKNRCFSKQGAKDPEATILAEELKSPHILGGLISMQVRWVTVKMTKPHFGHGLLGNYSLK